MTPIEVGISAVTMLLCTALGGFVYKYFLAKFFYPINSFRLCVLSFAIAIMMNANFYFWAREEQCNLFICCKSVMENTLSLEELQNDQELKA